MRGNRPFHFHGYRLVRRIVHDSQTLQHPAFRRAVKDEIHRQYFARSQRTLQRPVLTRRQRLPLPASNLQRGIPG